MKTLQLQLAEIPSIDCPAGRAVRLAPRDAALLAWLAIEGPTSRDRLSTLLWPGSSDEQARNTLRQRLFQLRKALGADVATGSPMLQLADAVQHDLADAARVLGDLALPDAPELDAWLRQQREHRRHRELDGLTAQSQALEEGGDPSAALPVALRVLRLSPLSEAAYQRVMRLHYLLGDNASALVVFDQCEQQLKHELGARPSAQTLALLATIEQARTPAPGAARHVLPAAVQRPPRMVGRDRERVALRQAWDAAHVAAVIGEAGVGKSRLLAEFINSEPNVVQVAGRPGDAGVPFATLARLLRAIGARTAGQAIEPEARHQLARVLPELGAAGMMFVEGQRLQLQSALMAYLRAADPLAGLVLDDLHFADAPSLEMLQALIEQAAGSALRWTIAFRPAEADSALLALQSALTEAARLAPIALAPLDETALAELVDQLDLGITGHSIAAQLYRRTGGNPLFVLETLKQAWVEKSLHELGNGATMPRPMSVERLIDCRIARLSAPALALARVASIAGADFGMGLAESVLQTGVMQFADALNELEDAQVLKGTQFAHDLVFDAVLRSVPGAIARYTHERVALWLAQHQGEPARIAQHWIDAGQPREAVTWLGEAAVRSERGLQLREAIAFLEHKAELETQAGDTLAAFDSAMQAARHSAGVDHEGASGDRRCDWLDRLAATPAQALSAQLWRGRLAELRDDPEAAEPMIRAALQRSIELGEAAMVARCRLRLAANLAIQDRPVEALELAQACRAWFENDGTDEERGELHGILAGIHDSDGRLADAREHHAVAAACFERAGHHGKVAQTHQSLAANHLYQGHSARARDHLLLALRGYGQHDDYAAARGPALAMLGACNTTLGRYREALDGLAEARALMAVHQPGGVAYMSLYAASCWRNLGQWARVHQSLNEVAGLLPSPPALRAGLLLQQHHLAKAKGEHSPALLQQALAITPADGQTTLRMLIEVEQAPDLACEEGLRQLRAVSDRAQRHGHFGVVLATHVRSAEIACAVDATLARQHALAALDLAAQHTYTGPYYVEPWLAAARALLVAGDERAATAALARGRDWIASTAKDHVPIEFRDGFLQRNPANEAFLALAARHGLSEPSL